MLPPADWVAILLSLRLAAVATALLLAIGLPLGWWLARARGAGVDVLATLVGLPLVLPPTVLGFYLLVALGPRSPLGGWWQELTGSPLVFSFAGLVVGSVLYSLPFVVQPLRTAFAAVPEDLLEAAATLGAGRLDRFATIALPLARRGLIAAGLLGFFHTLGEFGVVLMIGGSIPGTTRVASIALYDHVEALDSAAAHRLALVLVLASAAGVLAVQRLSRQERG